jgi:phosphoesterase RecJ-like protein
MMTVPEALRSAIDSSSDVVLATHIHPDADALGSLLGLAGILEQAGKRVLRYVEEPIPAVYRFLPGAEQLVWGVAGLSEFVRNSGQRIMAISLDCGDRQRLGKSGPKLMQIRPFAVIDHHLGNNGFGDLAWIEPRRSSTGEMIFDLAKRLGLPLTAEAAVCLYAAIVSDSGSFRYDSTTSHTFRVAAELVDAGADPYAVAGWLYDHGSFERLQLLQGVLAGMEQYAGGSVAVIRVSQQDLARTGTTIEDTEGLINLPRTVASVKVVALLKQTETDLVSVSLRAKGDCNVAAVAARFGGGGHRNAAGFRMPTGDIDKVVTKLLPAIEKQLQQQE